MNIKKLIKNKKGFTLIEIIVVIVILAVLMAVAVPSVLSYLGAADDAKYEAQARSVLTTTQIEVAKDATTSTGYVDTTILDRVQTASTLGAKLTDLKLYSTAGTIKDEGKSTLVWDKAVPLAAGVKGSDASIVGVSGEIDGVPFVAVINDKIYIGKKAAN